MSFSSRSTSATVSAGIAAAVDALVLEFDARLRDVAAEIRRELSDQLGASRPSGDSEPARLLTREQAANYLAISKSQLDILRRAKLLPAIVVGNSPRYAREDLDRFIESQRDDAEQSEK